MKLPSATTQPHLIEPFYYYLRVQANEDPQAVFKKSLEDWQGLNAELEEDSKPTPLSRPANSTSMSGARLARLQADELAQEQAIADEDEEAGKDKKHSTHFGDSDFDPDEEVGDASWSEVFEACCVHSPQEWGYILLGSLGVVFFLYFFLFGLDLLGNGAKVMSGCGAGSLFGDDTNPIAGVMVGILATVLLQSSSTTTSIIVSLVGDGEGSGTISAEQGIYMIMGANIGTSVTNTLVAMGHIGDGDQLERAFAGATVHDMFNFLCVAIMLPLEVITGFLGHLTEAMTKNAEVKDGENWEGPIKKIVSPLGSRVIIANKKISKSIAKDDKECSDFYPMDCGSGTPTYEKCDGKFGLIACDKDGNFCPSFFSKDADSHDDKVSGGVVFFIALIILFVCLMAMVSLLQRMLLGMSTRVIFKATDVNGYLSMAIGAGITVLVQSSSITTSTLTPLVGMGAIRLEQMYPLTLGANVGTTVTGLTAALVSDNIESLQVALAHLFFNIFGICLFYPIPYMRNIPMHCARQLGKATRIWRGFPVVYIICAFLLLPLLLLGISAIFEQDQKGFTVLGSFVVAIIIIACLYTVYWCMYLGGRDTCIACMERRERKRSTLENLPDDMDFVMRKLNALIDHTGLQDDDEDEEEEEGLLDESTSA